MTNLEIASARIDDCEKNGGDFLTLANLALTTDEFRVLIQDIKRIRTLKKLDMSNNELDEFPDEIRDLSFLEEANFSRNKITKLSHEIVNFEKLKVLNLAYNRLKKLPKNFINITACGIQRIDLSNNNLKSTPFIKHKSVILENNSHLLPINEAINNARAFSAVALLVPAALPVALPVFISAGIADYKKRRQEKRMGGVHNLERNNTILSVSNKELDLSGYNLSYEDLAIWISYIAELHPDLEVLKLGSNNISELPDSIDLLTNLKELDVSNNNLKTLPNTIGNLQHLRKVNMSFNAIETLPESMENLSGLEINLKCNFDETLVSCLPKKDELLISLSEEGVYPIGDVLPNMRVKRIIANRKFNNGLPNLKLLAETQTQINDGKEEPKKRFRFKKRNNSKETPKNLPPIT